MIRQIVFDMGKVLVGYDAKRVCRHFMSDEQEIEAVCTSVFVSPEWLLLDMGVITEEAALEKMQSRLKTDHEKNMAALCMKHWPEYCMWPIKEMEEVLDTLKEKGFGLYICSNASMRLPLEWKKVIPRIDRFDGVLFSAEEKCIKPQRQIYERLFERFQLKPEECFFVDDLPMNVEGARACGMDGYCFADGDVERLKSVLYSL